MTTQEEKAKNQKTRLRTNKLIKEGKIKKLKRCEICGTVPVRILGHHFSYDIDSILIWVCTQCHTRLHNSYYDNRKDHIKYLISDFVHDFKKEMERSIQNAEQYIYLVEKENSILIKRLKKLTQSK